MATIKLQLVTPERTLLKDELSSLTCPTTLGEIGVLPGHTPLVATLVPGELKVRKGGIEHFVHVSGGFVQIKPGSEVIILADSAEHFYEIDEAKAAEAEARARKLLSEEKLSGMEYAKVLGSLEISLTRIRVARKHAHRKTRPVTSEGVLEE